MTPVFERNTFTQCPAGGIGRHATLRWLCPKGRASSSLALGTILELLRQYAQLVKLVDTLSSGGSASDSMRVQVSRWAPSK